jgi:WhiB family redox-sensing transcriptional regulator
LSILRAVEVDLEGLAHAVKTLRMFLDEAEPWRRDALCAEYPHVHFFVERGESIAPARAVCSRCLVRYECRQFALDNHIDHGMWGGLSVRERTGRIPAPKPRVRAPSPKLEQPCQNHDVHGFTEPVGMKGRSGLCAFCLGFQREHGVVPPKMLLDARAEGHRIVRRLVDAALGGRQAA